MCQGTVLALHARALSLQSISCKQFLSRGVDIVRHLGYEKGGIKQNSWASQGMRVEARRFGGNVPAMSEGGVTASFQSIGATGYYKPQAISSVLKSLQHEGFLEDPETVPKLTCMMQNKGLIDPDDYLLPGAFGGPCVVARLPEYFVSNPNAAVSPRIVSDYKNGGYNMRKVEEMLNDSVRRDAVTGERCHCILSQSSKFKVRKLERIENKSIFDRYKRHEAYVAERLRAVSPPKKIDHSHSLLSPWLQRLAMKNDLCKMSGAVYLMHGTKKSNIASICQNGLTASKTLLSDGTYGRGIYFSNNSCKALQYSQNDGCILLCRVVLGRVELLQEQTDRFFPSKGYESAIAKECVTKLNGKVQVHNEFIVYEDAACYPEFVITCEQT